MQVRVRTPLRATEDPEKVAAAASAFWPDGNVTIGADHVEVVASDCDRLGARIGELRIIDTIRSGVLAGCDEDAARFRLSKQGAAAGRVSLPVGTHGLGELEIEVRIDTTDPWRDAAAWAWWLCPETRDGEVVG